nr:ATP-binding cassette domain-containing protein [Microbacterium sp. ISL-59]
MRLRVPDHADRICPHAFVRSPHERIPHRDRRPDQGLHRQEDAGACRDRRLLHRRARRTRRLPRTERRRQVDHAADADHPHPAHLGERTRGGARHPHRRRRGPRPHRLRRPAHQRKLLATGARRAAEPGCLLRDDAEDSAKRADELIESLDLTSFATRTVQQLSGGQKRRLDIALGLMHAPPLIFLDEPSTGLDPQSRANLWEHILDLRTQHGTTVFLTTHYLEEADRYAERVMVMDKGRIIADDDAASLKATLAGDVLTFGFADAAEAASARAVVARLSSAEVTVEGESISLAVQDGDRLLPVIVRELDAAGILVRRATGVPPTLDDVFLALTGRTLRDAGEGADAAGDASDSADTSTTSANSTTAANSTTGVLS